MANSAHVQLDLRRYADLVAAALPTDVSFRAETEDATTVQVERGTVYPLSLNRRVEALALERVDRLIRLAAPAPANEPPAPLPVLSSLSVVDRAGHRRPVYRPLLVYAWLQSFRLLYEELPRLEFGRWDEALRAWCDVLEARLTAARAPEGPSPAARGAEATELAWTALALFSAGRLFVRDAWTDLASDAFGRLARGQEASGALLVSGGSDNPELVWYHELALLHAAASYAVQAEDRTVASAVARATEYHLRETQPDHASAQPWALFGFIWNPATRPLADQLLHAAAVQHPGGPDGVSLILLADALYCLRLFQGAVTP